MREKRIFKLTRNQKIEEEKQFAVNNIIDQCKKNNWKKIGVTSSSRNYRGTDLITRLLNKTSAENKVNLEFCELKPVSYFSDALQEAKTCDGVILSETYGYTYYSELDKCTEILEENDISIGGVIIFR